ncbi:transposase InsO family protein [Bradyrhizobium diazoefficiens]
MARELKEIVERRGKPGMIASDHGTEFTCNAMLAWSKDTVIDWHFIAPGKPMQNGFIERFMYRRAARMQGISAAIWISVGCVHVYGLSLRPIAWPLALMEIADRGLINGSRLLRLKLFCQSAL